MPRRSGEFVGVFETPEVFTELVAPGVNITAIPILGDYFLHRPR